MSDEPDRYGYDGIIVTIDHVEPPDDVKAVHARDVMWYEIATDAGSYASVAFSASTRMLLLHWIRSERRGDGWRLMQTLNGMQDALGFGITAVCELAMCPWYQRQGWTVDGPLLATGMYTISRRPA